VGVGAGLYMYDVVVKTFTFAISSTDEFLYIVFLFSFLYKCSAWRGSSLRQHDLLVSVSYQHYC